MTELITLARRRGGDAADNTGESAASARDPVGRRARPLGALGPSLPARLTPGTRERSCTANVDGCTHWPPCARSLARAPLAPVARLRDTHPARPGRPSTSEHDRRERAKPFASNPNQGVRRPAPAFQARTQARGPTLRETPAEPPALSCRPARSPRFSSVARPGARTHPARGLQPEPTQTEASRKPVGRKGDLEHNTAQRHRGGGRATRRSRGGGRRGSRQRGGA